MIIESLQRVLSIIHDNRKFAKRTFYYCTKAQGTYKNSSKVGKKYDRKL